MKIKFLLLSLLSIFITSCAMDVPVHQTGGGGYGYPQHHTGGGYSHGGHPAQYHNGGGGYYGGPNGAGQTIYHGSQARHVYGNGPQSYAGWAQPQITYQGF